MHHKGDRRLRIALAINSDGPGGAEQMITMLAAELARRGHQPLLITARGGVGWLPRQFESRGMRSELHSKRHFYDPRSTFEMVRMLRDHSVDVLHSHEFTFAMYGHLATRFLRIPHIVTLHGSTYFDQRRRRRWAMRRIVAGSRATVAVSQATRDHLTRSLGISGDAVHVVPNGIAFTAGVREVVRRELGLGEEDLMIVAVGNLYPVKGHRTLVEAFGQLKQREPQLRWHGVIAGRGREEAVLRELAAAAAISDRVHLLGYRADVADILAAADVLAMPSLSEGLPLALLEAMMAGLPIVASAVGGIPEVVEHERDALLVPAADPKALALALARLASNAQLRSDLGARARRRAEEHFTLERMCNRYLDLYSGPAN